MNVAVQPPAFKEHKDGSLELLGRWPDRIVFRADLRGVVLPKYFVVGAGDVLYLKASNGRARYKMRRSTAGTLIDATLEAAMYGEVGK